MNGEYFVFFRGCSSPQDRCLWFHKQGPVLHWIYRLFETERWSGHSGNDPGHELEPRVVRKTASNVCFVGSRRVSAYNVNMNVVNS